MLGFKEWFVNVLTNDATLQGLLGASSSSTMPIYPFDVDITPDSYPVITYSEAGIAILPQPKGMHTGRFQYDVWSINNDLEVENIYERIAVLLQYQSGLVSTQALPGGTLYWVREDDVRDFSSPDRRMWRKTVTLKIFFQNSDFH